MQEKRFALLMTEPIYIRIECEAHLIQPTQFLSAQYIHVMVKSPSYFLIMYFMQQFSLLLLLQHEVCEEVSMHLILVNDSKNMRSVSSRVLERVRWEMSNEEVSCPASLPIFLIFQFCASLEYYAQGM